MTDTNAMREGIDKLRRDQAERCAHAEYHRGYDYALTDVLAWLDCALLATGRAAGVGEVERWAKFVEEYCHEPYGYRRENVCCAATACDIAGAMREAVSPVNEIAQIMNANSQDIKFSPVLPHPSSDFLYRPTEPPVYPGRSDASPPAPADASSLDPLLCRCENARRKGMPMLCVQCTGPVGLQAQQAAEAPPADASGEVERVAKAIYEEDDPWCRAWPWPDLNTEAQGGQGTADRYRDIARAALAAMQPRGEQQEWPADAAFPLGALVQKKGRASWRGKIVGWYRTDITAIGYAVESAFEPGSVQIYPETALLAWDGEQQAAREELSEALFNALMASSEHVADPIPLPQPSDQATRLAHTATPETFPKDSYGLAMWLDRALQAGREEGR